MKLITYNSLIQILIFIALFIYNLFLNKFELNIYMGTGHTGEVSGFIIS